MPSQAMRGAVKQITKLHESVSLVLPEAQVEVSSLYRIETEPLLKPPGDFSWNSGRQPPSEGSQAEIGPVLSIRIEEGGYICKAPARE